MLGSGGGVRPGAGWSITSDFRRLMVSPKALAASDMQLASSCRSGSFTATRASRLRKGSHVQELQGLWSWPLDASGRRIVRRICSGH